MSCGVASTPGQVKGLLFCPAPLGAVVLGPLPVDSDGARGQPPNWGCLDHSNRCLQGHAVHWLIKVLLPCQSQVGEYEDEEDA